MAASSSGQRDGDRLLRFGALLAGALRSNGMRQDDLARILGTTQSSVSGWINGKYEPAAETVFAIERALGLEPGHLSRPLGYLPAERGNGPVSVEGAIAENTFLDEEQKAVLVAMYQVLVRQSKKGPAGRKARMTAAGGRRARART